jgi:transmembrane sensor
MDAGALGPEETAIFEAWLAADIRHLGAYGKAEAVLARVQRISGVGGNALRPPAAMAAAPFGWSRRRALLSGGAVAGLVAAGVSDTVLWRHRLEEDEQSYATAVGQIQKISLADGSIVTLNTNSRVVVRYSAQLREIHLNQGEALFDVAKNKKRPFVVFAGDAQIRAVGTVFTVRLLRRQPVQVLVKEGIVEVKRTDAAFSMPLSVRANTKTLISKNAPIVSKIVPEAQIARDLAWQAGQISFDNETIGDAAEEFARYSDTRIVVDPAIANRTVTGLFVSNDPVGFAMAAAKVLNLHAEVYAKEVKISR